MDLRAEISAAVSTALASLGADGVEPALEPCARPEFGDWATPAALRAARVLRKAPLAIAEDLCAALGRAPLAVVAEWTVSAPGYVNARLAEAVWVPAVLDAALALAPDVPVRTAATPLSTRTLVEHTATNPNKAAHVGHLRNACIGDSVARILRRSGCEVEVQNYIDDTGVQVADVTVGVRELGIAQEPGEAFDQYCSRVYVEVGRRYESDPSLLERRAATLHAIEAGDNETAVFVKDLASRIVDHHLDTMARFGIDYELLAWESDILRLGFWRQAYDQLVESGAIVKAESGKLAGCWVMPAETAVGADADGPDDNEDDGKVFVKSNGIATYTAKDTAYQLWKFGLLGRDFEYRPWPNRPGLMTTTSSGGDDGGGRFGAAKRVINVIDARQAYPQGVVKQALARLGHVDEAANSIHLGYEVVALSPGAAAEVGIDISDGKEMYAFAGRKGIEIRADELLDRAIERVRQKSADSPNDVDAAVTRQVAAGAMRYYLQKFTLMQIIAFDFDEALRTTGDTGVYLQFAHARAAGILRKVPADDGAVTVPATLDPVERALLHRLDAYADALADAAAELSPSTLCTYAFSLASAFTSFIEHTPAIVREADPTMRRFRRQLVAATKLTLGDALTTLGIGAPEKI